MEIKTPTDTGPACCRCHWWDSQNSVAGKCKRMPPAPHFDDGHYWTFTGRADWCGEFKSSRGISDAKMEVVMQDKSVAVTTPKDFKCELKSLLNSFSRENASNTPDFILAEYMMSCLESFERATKRRDGWYGIELCPGQRRPQ